MKRAGKKTWPWFATAETIAAIRPLARQGLTDRQIGARIGLKVFQVQKIRSVAGIQAGQPPIRRAKSAVRPETPMSAAHWTRNKVRFDDDPKAARPEIVWRPRLSPQVAQACASSLVGLEGAS